MNFFNIHDIIQIASSLFFLMFSVALVGISLLGEVIRVCSGDNQWRGGIVILGGASSITTRKLP